MALNMRNITFASFNLHNLQLPGGPMYPQSRPYTDAEYAEKIWWQADRLRALNADVVAFQEVWSADALREMIRTAAMEDDYDLAFIREGDWDGVAVACAVRKPWEILATTRHKAFPGSMRLAKRKRSMENIREEPPLADAEVSAEDDDAFVPSQEDERVQVDIDEFSRSVLQVTIGHSRATRPSVPPMEVFCAHLKSKLATPLDNEEYRNPAIQPHRAALGTALSTIRRIAEATALRIILTETMKDNDRPVAVLGDLNDSEHSNTLAILTGQPSFRVVATSRAAKRDDDGLYSAVALQKLRSLGDVYYTHEYRNVREVIDHIMVSEQFYDWSDNRLWSFQEQRYYNDHVPVETRTATDHGLVRAEFRWAPAEGVDV